MTVSIPSIRIMQIIPNGDSALLVRFEYQENGVQVIQALANSFQSQPLADLINVIPATDSLVLVFEKPVNHQIDWHAALQSRIDGLALSKSMQTVHEIPVCYDASLATDLNAVSAQLNLSITQLIAAHTKSLYQVSMLGFLPGFAYLSGNDEQINLPRKSSPTLSVPAGSVAIANGQTGLYALSSPGGWHVIGRTPINLFNWHNARPNLVKPLDQVRFKAIDLPTFNHLTLAHEH